MKNIECKNCINSRPIISENGIHYNCTFSSKRAIKCMLNDWCYYNELKFSENGELKIVDITGIEVKW